VRSTLVCHVPVIIQARQKRKHSSKAETKVLKQGGNGTVNPWKGWRIIAQGERSEPWVDRRDLKPTNGGDARGSVFRERFPSPLPGMDGHGIAAPGLASLALGFIPSPLLGG